LKYSWLNMQKTRKDRKVTGSRDDKKERVVARRGRLPNRGISGLQ
jgi:hypothetical protein